MPDTFRSIASHAVTLACGRPLAPGDGDAGLADMNDPHDQALLADGHLIAIEGATDDRKEKN